MREPTWTAGKSGSSPMGVTGHPWNPVAMTQRTSTTATSGRGPGWGGGRRSGAARGAALALVATLLIPGCSSDPTQSEVYLELDQQRQDLEARVSQLEGELATIATDLDDLLESGGLESAEELSVEAAELDDRHSELTSDLEELGTELESLTETSDSLSTEVEDLATQITELEEMLRQVQERDFA